jgi:hypothetical protein
MADLDKLVQKFKMPETFGTYRRTLLHSRPSFQSISFKNNFCNVLLLFLMFSIFNIAHASNVQIRSLNQTVKKHVSGRFIENQKIWPISTVAPIFNKQKTAILDGNKNMQFPINYLGNNLTQFNQGPSSSNFRDQPILYPQSK